jgi:hypothetical protein
MQAVRTKEAKALGKDHRGAGGKKTAKKGEEHESPTWLDSDQFKAYIGSIADVLLSAGRPLSTREIHALLDDKAHISWTQDALEIGKYFGRQGVLVTRYFMIFGPHRNNFFKLDQDAEHDRIFEN